MRPILELCGVCFEHNSKFSLKDITFSTERNDFMGIIGPNGSGKSTLLRLMNGCLKPQSGHVLVEGMDIWRMKRKDIARKIAVLPQESVFHFTFDCLEIVLQGRAPHLSAFRLEGKEDLEIALECMRLTDTSRFIGRSINSLSGGERQRVLLARAITQRSELLILDEPTTNLDLKYQIELMELIREIGEKKSITIIMVSHDVNLASAYCSNLVLLKDGILKALGKPATTLTRENLESLFNAPFIVETNPLTGTPRVFPLYKRFP